MIDNYAVRQKTKMTTVQKRKILARIVALEQDIETLKSVRTEIAASGYASATLATSGGSKSYTRQSVSQINEAIAQMSAELKGLNRLLNGANPATPGQIITVWS